MIAAGVAVDARVQRGLIDAITTGGQQAADYGELQLLCGDLLPDWDEIWLAAARQELRLLRLLSIEAIATAQLAEQRPGSALAIGLLAVRDEPLRESAQRLVIEAHLAQGNLAEAARQYLRYRSLLWDELGLHPSLGMEKLIDPLRCNAHIDGAFGVQDTWSAHAAIGLAPRAQTPRCPSLRPGLPVEAGGVTFA